MRISFSRPFAYFAGIKNITIDLHEKIIAAAFLLIATVTAQAKYESKFANVNGTRIHYLKAGTGKKALVLIHGFGDTSLMWTPLFDEFGKTTRSSHPTSEASANLHSKKLGTTKRRRRPTSTNWRRASATRRSISSATTSDSWSPMPTAAQFPNDVHKLALLEAPIPGIGDIWEKIFTTPSLWHFILSKARSPSTS
jgi:hypothetical protein